MFHIIASDLDGTLLNPNQQITSFTIKILQLLTNTNNIHFIFATGRHYKNIINIRKTLKINAYAITANGARIHNSHGELISFHNLNKKIILDLITIVHDDPNIVTNIFRNNEWLINRTYKFNQQKNIQKNNMPYQLYKKNTLALNGINKIYFYSNNYKQLLKLEKKLYVKWGNHINISFSSSNCLEITPEGVSKGHALKKVANLLGYQLKDCISFGDAMNDKEMLQMSGKGCIMLNAQKRLKNELPLLEIIGSNKEDSVPHYLKNLFLV